MNCVRTRGEEPPRLYGVINGLLRMRNGLRRSQELDDLVDVLASSIGAPDQSAYQLPTPEKVAQEKASLLEIDDSFQKIVLVRDVVKPARDEHGILTMSVYDFLLDPDSLTM